MNTIKDKLAESTSYLDEYVPQDNRSTEQKENELLDNILELQENINNTTKFYKKATPLIQKLSWAEDEGDYDAEIIDEIKVLQADTKRIINSGLKDYVFFNNNFKRFASVNIKLFKDAVDEFKETTQDVFDKLLETRTDREFLDLEKKIKEL
jgi:uncharacterized protein YecE (DUF72 family)